MDQRVPPSYWKSRLHGYWSVLWPTVLGALLLLLWIAAALPPPSALPLLHAEMAKEPAGVIATVPQPAELDWQPLQQHELASWRGPYWLRFKFAAPTSDDTPSDEDLTLFLSSRAASELYWNGALLARNGSVGQDRLTEQPGRVELQVSLPKFSVGTQTLLVRASSHHQWLALRHAAVWLLVAPAETLAAWRYRPWLLTALSLGALLASMLYLATTQRRAGAARLGGRSVLLLLCLTSTLLLAIESWRALLGYSYPWHGLRLLMLLLLHVTAALALPWYLARRYQVNLPWKVTLSYFALLLLAIVLPSNFDARGFYLLLASYVAAQMVLGKVSTKDLPLRRLQALIALALLAVLVLGGFFLDGPCLLILSVLALVLLLQHADAQRALDARNVQLEAERSRLGLEVLQRAMQPHWLMNTLTTLQELIEQDPPRASRLVELLAELFAKLRMASGRVAIPLADEVAICRQYLDIVGWGLQLPIRFEVDELPATMMVPGGILHAQIENALTHAGATACSKRPFRLQVEQTAGHCRLLLHSALGTRTRSGQGTGTAFIEASLAAHSAGPWHFEQRCEGDDWYSEVLFTCAS